MAQSGAPGRKFPSELLQKIKDTVNIVDVVGEHVVLRKSGANHTGLCPFHSERTPSFSVSEGKQLYHCYGCKKGGDLVSFVQEIYGISFPEAITELAERARVALPKEFSHDSGSDDPEAQKRRAEAREKLATAYKLNRFVASFYHQMLAQSPDATRYFARRGVGVDLGREFYVGVAPGEWEGLAEHLTAKKAPLPLAVELGLIRPSKQAAGGISKTGYFDLFRNRAMFPILDMRGKVAGFGGRTLPGGKGGDAEGPKYMNSPESFLFQKSKLAFGLYQAQKHIREKDEVILVEGYFDVVALHAAGFKNVVATCGTSLTPEHLRLFRRFGSRVTVLFDGDAAGISATGRAMEVGLAHGMVLYGAVMPEGLDPDEVLFDQETGTPTADGKERMSAILSAAQPLLDSRIDEAIAKAAQGPEARTQALKQIAAWLAQFQDPVGREVRLQTVQTKLGVSRDLLAKAAAASGERRSSASALEPTQSTRPMPQQSIRVGGMSAATRKPVTRATVRLTQTDRALLAAWIRGSKVFTEVVTKLPPDRTVADLFDYPAARELVTLWVQDPEIQKRGQVSPESILEKTQDSQVSTILREALMATDLPFEEADLKNALDKATGRAWARFSQQIKTAIAEAEAKKDAGLQSRLMKEYLDVQRKMKEFNSFYDEA